MKEFFDKLIGKMNPPKEETIQAIKEDDALSRQVAAIYGLLAAILGSDKLVLRAGKLDALEQMRSEDVKERILALEKLVYENPTLEKLPEDAEIPRVLEELEEEIADIMARRTVEEKIEKKISDKMDERHQEYVKEIKMQVLKEENATVETPQSLKRYAA